MSKEKIDQIKNILIKWDPAKSSLFPVQDLDEYETEVEDLLFQLEIEYDYPEKMVTQKQVQKILREVLNEAFNLHLNDNDVQENAQKILELLN